MPNVKAKEFELVSPSDRANLIQEIEKLAEKASDYAGFSDEDRDSIAIAITEVGNNAINHGNKRRHDKNVTVKAIAKDGEVRIMVSDEGGGFDPEGLRNPLDPENLLRESGRGVFIIRSLMDEVEFDFSKSGTTVTILKRRKKQKPD